MTARAGDPGPPVALSSGLTIRDVVAVAREGRRVAPLAGGARERVQASRDIVTGVLEQGGPPVYGITTGYGSLARTRIAPADAARLSRNVILKCAVGVGDPLPEDWVRAMLLLRANSLAQGVSGVRPVIVDTLIEMMNRGVIPRVPAKGSLGASGDLAPLAHIALVATRGPDEEPGVYSGHAWVDGDLLTGEEAMGRAGIPRPAVEAKDGLALTNGTTMMVAAAALGVHDARSLLEHAELAAALSMEGLCALTSALDPALHEVNRQPGQVRSAARLRALLEGSRLVDSDPDRVQDAYSVRCTPQVLGPIHDLVDFLEVRVEAAINAASDNPLVFPGGGGTEGRTVSGGNFHGAGPALWLDILGIAVSEIASLSDRRVFRMLTPELSGGLPPMLIEKAGLNGGLMSAQYTGAALVSDNKTLAHPDSVDSIPTSANQEDHVSMGANAARHTCEILENVRMVLAVELLAAFQAVHLREEGPEALGRGTAAVWAALRECVEPVVTDRALAPDLERIAGLVEDGVLVRAVSAAAGDDAQSGA